MTSNAKSRVVTSATGGITTTNSYDGNGLRVKKQVGAGTPAVYIFSGAKVIAEYASGAAATSPQREYIYSGSQLLAKIEGTATSYYHADHLSVRVTTDTTGTVVGTQGHYPFGETWYETGVASKWKFTSYERDGGSGESGNDYAIMRSSINRLARFSSPDPLAGSIADPQSLNRYAYTRNDPVNFVDPLGLCHTNPPGPDSPPPGPFCNWTCGCASLNGQEGSWSCRWQCGSGGGGGGGRGRGGGGDDRLPGSVGGGPGGNPNDAQEYEPPVRPFGSEAEAYRDCIRSTGRVGAFTAEYGSVIGLVEAVGTLAKLGAERLTEDALGALSKNTASRALHIEETLLAKAGTDPRLTRQVVTGTLYRTSARALIGKVLVGAVSKVSIAFAVVGTSIDIYCRIRSGGGPG